MDLLLILGEKWNSCSQQSALPYTVACCCRNTRAKRFLSSNAAIFEASVTFHVQTGLCVGHMICYTPNSWCQELSSSDFWHQPSLNTLHCAAFSRFSLFPVCLLSHIPSFIFLFPFCVPPQRSGLQLKLIQAWKGSDDFSWKNCILFAYCFEPCYYPVACFTVIPLNRKTGMEKPLHCLCLVQTAVHFKNIPVHCTAITKKCILYLFCSLWTTAKIHSTYSLTVWISRWLFGCKIYF